MFDLVPLTGYEGVVRCILSLMTATATHLGHIGFQPEDLLGTPTNSCSFGLDLFDLKANAGLRVSTLDGQELPLALY